MSADIVRRLIDSAEDANDDLREKSFHRTISNEPAAQDAANQIERLTNADSTNSLKNGKALYASLTERAQQKAHLDQTLGSDSTVRNYHTSLIGSTGKDAELRRQLTMQQREDRKIREDRFRNTQENDERFSRSRSSRKHENKRQRFNADRSSLNDTTPASDTSPRIVFREPPSRGYDPYSG